MVGSAQEVKGLKGPCAKDVVFGDGAASCLPRFLALVPGGGEVLVSQIKSKSVW